MARSKKKPTKPTPKPEKGVKPQAKKSAQQKSMDWMPWMLFAFGALLYVNTCWNDYTLDDFAIIVNHEHVQAGIDGIGKIFTTNYLNGFADFNDGLYRPLSPMLFALEIDLLGGGPGVHHFFNMLYYALTGFVLFLFLRALLKDRHALLPLVISVLFVAHPIHTDAVSGIKGRDEVLAMLNLLLCALFFLRYLDRNKVPDLLVGAFWFVLAMLSKESAITFVVAIPILFYFFRPVKLVQLLSVGGVLAVVAIGMFWWRTKVIDSMPTPMDAGITSLLNNSLAGAEGVGEKLASVASLQLHYLWKLLVPFNLAHDYSYNQIPVVGLTDLMGLLGLLVLAGMAFWAIRGAKQKDPIAFFVWFYAATISVAANLLMLIGVTMAERLLYAPSLGFCILLGILLLEKGPVKGGPKADLGTWFRLNRPRALVWLAVVSIFSIQTVVRNTAWADNKTLYETDVNRVAGSARAHYNWGTELQRQGKQLLARKSEADALFAESVKELERAVAIYPEYLDALNNLGTSYMLLGQFPQAEQAYFTILKMDQPYNKAYYNLGSVYYRQNKYQETIDAMGEYVKRVPNTPQAYYMIGSSLGNLGKFDEAARILETGISYAPNNPDLLINLGQAYGILGNLPKAQETLTKATQAAPNRPDSWQNLGITAMQLQQYAQAEQAFKQAVRLQPGDQRSRQMLAQVLQAQGKQAEANQVLSGQ